MVKPFAIIEDGVVVNIALAEEDFAAQQGWVFLPLGAGIGWLYDKQQFSPPLPLIPSREVQERARAAAYAVEADPLFFMSQRGEATMDEWLAKVAEIKARFPYPKEA